jgi:hypothetical protein
MTTTKKATAEPLGEGKGKGGRLSALAAEVTHTK